MLRKTLVAAVVAGSLATLAVAAGPGGEAASPFRGMGAESPLGRTISGCVGRLLTLRSDLAVTDEQRSQIRDVLGSHRPEIAATVKSVRDARTNLRDLVLSDTASESEIRTAAHVLGDQIAEAAVKAATLRKELAPILTEAQRSQVQTFLEANDAAIDKFLTNAAETH